MEFTQKRVSDILTQLLEEENGLNTVLKLTLEVLTKSERTEYNFSNGDSSNDYRIRSMIYSTDWIEHWFRSDTLCLSTTLIMQLNFDYLLPIHCNNCLLIGQQYNYTCFLFQCGVWVYFTPKIFFIIYLLINNKINKFASTKRYDNAVCLHKTRVLHATRLYFLQGITLEDLQKSTFSYLTVRIILKEIAFEI